jgi:hypothetical protein
MDDQFLEDMNDLASRIQSHADSLDGQRIAQMAKHIINHDWDLANGLIIAWSVADMPDWDEIVEDPFDGGYSHV